jgi:hypothetical protein
VTQVPVFINCRDRLTPLLELLDYLERAGCEQIHLLDNDSTYPPLLEYYEQTPHSVIRLGENVHRRTFWENGLLDELGVRGRYVFTDPDLVPIEECPLDAIDYFGEVLDRYPGYEKVGFGLKIDDLPDHFRLKSEVLTWEARFWQRLVAPRLYEARIDTTFALYRGPEHAPEAAIRTGYPYVVRHTSWYLDSADPPEEHRYYIEHARPTTWSRAEMAGGPDANPHRHRKMTEKLKGFAELPTDVVPVDAAGPGQVTEIEIRNGQGFDEVTAWWQTAPPGALVVIHGMGDEHETGTGNSRLGALIRELGIPGVFLRNPRGGFLGFKRDA